MNAGFSEDRTQFTTKNYGIKPLFLFSALLIHPNVDKDKADHHPIVNIGQHFAKQGKTVRVNVFISNLQNIKQYMED